MIGMSKYLSPTHPVVLRPNELGKWVGPGQKSSIRWCMGNMTLFLTVTILISKDRVIKTCSAPSVQLVKSEPGQ